MSDFKREDRYLIFKREDLEQLPAKHRQRLGQIQEAVKAIRRGKPLTGVVVESDWPIYTATWDNIKAMATQQSHMITDHNLTVSAVINALEYKDLAPCEYFTEACYNLNFACTSGDKKVMLVTNDEQRAALQIAIDALNDVMCEDLTDINKAAAVLADLMEQYQCTTSS